MSSFEKTPSDTVLNFELTLSESIYLFAIKIENIQKEIESLKSLLNSERIQQVLTIIEKIDKRIWEILAEC